jgi:hypothetical protein
VTLTVRAASPADLAALPAIELSGDAMFAELGIVFPPGPAAVETAIAHGASIVVAGDPPVAFAAVLTLDGHPHLEQISVRADQTRNGIGSLLLDNVVRSYGPALAPSAWANSILAPKPSTARTGCGFPSRIAR